MTGGVKAKLVALGLTEEQTELEPCRHGDILLSRSAGMSWSNVSTCAGKRYMSCWGG